MYAPGVAEVVYFLLYMLHFQQAFLQSQSPVFFRKKLAEG